MRTTVTLDADVEQLLRDAMRRTRKSFKATLNDALRRALTEGARVKAEPFRVEARRMGLRAGIDPGRFNQLADELEAEAFMEATRTVKGEGGGS